MNNALRQLISLVSLWGSLASADDYRAGVDGYGNYFNQFHVCSDSPILVDEMSLFCDSPGTYYYGSGKYRNSAICQGGDRGTLRLEFEVTSNLNAAYMTLSVSGYGSVESKILYQSESICSISAISLQSGETKCPEGYPAIGNYVIYQRFYLNEQNDDYKYSFTPKIVVGFSSSQNNKNYYDYGGANTDNCKGDTHVNWTTGVAKTAGNTLRTFIATFGLLSAAVMLLAGAAYFIKYHADYNEKETVKDIPEEEEIMDYQKMAMVGQQKDLVDF